MIHDITIGKPAAPAKTWKSELIKLKEVKEALRRHKLGLPPEEIKLEDIPF